MEKSMLIVFEVFPDSVPKAEILIHDFVENIRKHEPATRLYLSFRDISKAFRFTHVMIFENEEAQQQHRNSAYVKTFTESLYPICAQEPQFTEVVHFISK